MTNTAHWMRSLDDYHPITRLAIPGTHDTMTHTCPQRYYRTQHLSLWDQLQCGTRFFDLRLTKNMVAAHREWISDISVHDIFSTLMTFLEQNPSEFIMARIQNANENKDDFPEYTQALHENIARYTNNMYIFGAEEKARVRWPMLHKVRGRIIALECAPHEYGATVVNNQRWAAYWHGNETILLQDEWDGPALQKKKEAIEHMVTATHEENILALNHISATNGELGYPDAYAAELNPFTGRLNVQLSNSSQDSYGVQIFDFIDEKLAQSVIQLNKRFFVE
ncbi:MAG: hypothetical protein Q4P66_00435 [Actinomycetaceae bacterium]|nr:hypothetical protein [Actinomycetaceae bacterium]